MDFQIPLVYLLCHHPSIEQLKAARPNIHFPKLSLTAWYCMHVHLFLCPTQSRFHVTSPTKDAAWYTLANANVVSAGSLFLRTHVHFHVSFDTICRTIYHWCLILNSRRFPPIWGNSWVSMSIYIYSFTHKTSREKCHPIFIAQIAPIPHKLRQVRWGEVHASMITQWSPACLQKLLPRGHQTGN